MNNSVNRNIVVEYGLISVGVTLLALAINVFYAPNDLVTGGASGVAIILKSLGERADMDIPIWLTNVAINVPLFLVSFKIMGFKSQIKTLYATAFLSFMLYALGGIPTLETDLTLTAVYGGVLAGIGLGLVFRFMATTGGSDLAASLIHNYAKHVSVAQIMFVIDAIIISAGFFVFGATKALYAIISVYLCSKIVDVMLEGLSFGKAAFIISEKTELISKEIFLQIERGATGFPATGMYTGKPMNVLLCVVSTKEIYKLKQLVNNVDRDAFVIVADVREVLGEGFTSLS